MKTNIFKSVLLSTCFFLFLSISLSAQKAKLEHSINNDRGPLIKASIKITNSCKVGYSCGSWLNYVKKINAIEITNQSFNFYPSLVYEIYNCPNTPILPCILIETFICTDQVVTYASTKLTNGDQAIIILKDTKSSNSETKTIKNGAFNGQICGPDSPNNH